MNIKVVGLQIIASAVLLTTAHSTFALSCMQPDPVRECKQMQSDNRSPVLANGRLTLERIISQTENPVNIGGQGPAVALYRFTGSISDKLGKNRSANTRVLLTTSCAGPWCASLPENEKSGVFLLENERGLKLKLGACSFQPFRVTAQQTEELEACVTPEPVKPKTAKKKGNYKEYRRSKNNRFERYHRRIKNNRYWMRHRRNINNRFNWYSSQQNRKYIQQGNLQKKCPTKSCKPYITGRVNPVFPCCHSFYLAPLLKHQ